jgi:DNA repair protein RecN (Recombination protein N)
VLVELTIRGFAIIDELQVTFGPAFNVLTGETGAGKSIIIDAVASLLGGKLDQEQVRAGEDQATVEAVFTIAGPVGQRVWPLLGEYGIEEDVDTPGDSLTLILRRDLRAGGRSVCRINGHAVPLRVMEEIGQYLIDIHGQGDHLLLLRRREQIGFLDRYGGLVEDQKALATRVRQLRQIRQELDALRSDERELARRIDMLQFEVGEIDAARLSPGEEDDLLAERTRLANAEKLAELSAAICTLLDEGDGDGAPAMVDLLGQTLHLLSDISRVDATLDEPLRILQDVSYQIEDVARSMHTYRDEIEFNPRRLEQVESRLGLIYNLRRKYGERIEDVLAYAEKARSELSQIENAGERIQSLEEQEKQLLQEIGQQGESLSARRREAGCRLARAVEGELADLRMEHASFAVGQTRDEDPEGAPIGGARYRFDTTGVDRVEFLISANPGEPLRPLANVASGGETSRLMLALKNVLTAVDEVPTLIFDEIDSGIGGVVGSLVGQKLRRLADQHQVLCVTHLPQLAASGSRQFKVEKVVDNGRTTTAVRELSVESRIEEIAQMMGAVSPATRRSAREMLGLPAD